MRISLSYAGIRQASVIGTEAGHVHAHGTDVIRKTRLTCAGRLSAVVSGYCAVLKETFP